MAITEQNSCLISKQEGAVTKRWWITGQTSLKCRNMGLCVTGLNRIWVTSIPNVTKDFFLLVMINSATYLSYHPNIGQGKKYRNDQFLCMSNKGQPNDGWDKAMQLKARGVLQKKSITRDKNPWSDTYGVKSQKETSIESASRMHLSRGGENLLI